jgi:predicted transcriptional regulator YheO
MEERLVGMLCLNVAVLAHRERSSSSAQAAATALKTIGPCAEHKEVFA